MHVVHLSLGFVPAVDGRAFLDQVPVLPRFCEETTRVPGCRVTVLGRFERDEDFCRNGVDYRFRVDEPKHLLAGRRTFPARLLGLARRIRPEVVHVHGLLFPVQTALLRAFLGRGPAVVVQHHGERPEGRMRPGLQRLLFRAADGFLFTARGIANEWVRAGVLDAAWPIAEVVEASTDFIPVAREEARVQAGLKGSPALLWVGRLHEKKDPMTALAGFARALESLPEAHLSMAFREAPLLAAIREIVASTPRLAGRVHLLGEIAHSELPAYFSAADLFLTSSPAEGSNFALLEALACGTPAVASGIPAHRALTGDGSAGELFGVGDPEACARAIVAASGRSSDDARANVRRHFEEQLSWTAVARQAAGAYEHLAAGRSHR